MVCYVTTATFGTTVSIKISNEEYKVINNLEKQLSYELYDIGVMAEDLKSYVEKYLLNPVSLFEEDESTPGSGKVEETNETEGVQGISTNLSKLRAESSALLSDVDAQYKGKKVTRKDLNLRRNTHPSPELTGFEGCTSFNDDRDTDAMDEISDADDDGSGGGGGDDDDDDDDDDNSIYNKLFSGSTEKSFSSEESCGEDGEDAPHLDESEVESCFSDDVEEKRVSSPDSGSLKGDAELCNFNIGTLYQPDEVYKANAVKSQLAMFDLLFEIRIGLQKAIGIANQLPQYNTLNQFMSDADENFTNNLSGGKKACRHVLTDLLGIRQAMSQKFPETQDLFTEKNGRNTKKLSGDSSDEMDIQGSVKKKRRLKIDDYGEVLKTHHEELVTFRDKAIESWYEKTKLLTLKKSHKNFDAFEVPVLMQLNNLLSNKEQLIKRTQLIGSSRGHHYRVLGKPETPQAENDTLDEYDPEIFDDYDFYSRCLEEVLKSKISVSKDSADISRTWINIQNLRKRAKRSVDPKASKGRKLKYDVMSKLQQYMAPSKLPQMDDVAINMLFASVFGKAVKSR